LAPLFFIIDKPDYYCIKHFGMTVKGRRQGEGGTLSSAELILSHEARICYVIIVAELLHPATQIYILYAIC
jgi:hypothetical protein